MSTEAAGFDAAVTEAIEELEDLIRNRYPSASFKVWKEDHQEVYLTAAVDVEDTDDVVDLVIDTLLDIQVERGLPLVLLPVSTQVPKP